MSARLRPVLYITYPIIRTDANAHRSLPPCRLSWQSHVCMQRAVPVKAVLGATRRRRTLRTPPTHPLCSTREAWCVLDGRMLACERASGPVVGRVVGRSVGDRLRVFGAAQQRDAARWMVSGNISTTSEEVQYVRFVPVLCSGQVVGCISDYPRTSPTNIMHNDPASVLARLPTPCLRPDIRLDRCAAAGLTKWLVRGGMPRMPRSRDACANQRDGLHSNKDRTRPVSCVWPVAW